MNTDPKYLTMLFSRVGNVKGFEETFKKHIHYPIVKHIAQNDGVVVFVVSSFPLDNAEAFLKDFLQNFGFNEVEFSVVVGNRFE